jgi:hypothetical protein
MTADLTAETAPPRPGALVDYRGSLTEHRGRYRVLGWCDCDRQACADQQRHGSDRYELVRLEGEPGAQRERTLEHVRRSSFVLAEPFVRSYHDIVTGDVRCWQVVTPDGQVLADGLATDVDAEAKRAELAR